MYILSLGLSKNVEPVIKMRIFIVCNGQKIYCYIYTFMKNKCLNFQYFSKLAKLWRSF